MKNEKKINDMSTQEANHFKCDIIQKEELADQTNLSDRKNRTQRNATLLNKSWKQSKSIHSSSYMQQPIQFKQTPSNRSFNSNYGYKGQNIPENKIQYLKDQLQRKDDIINYMNRLQIELSNSLEEAQKQIYNLKSDFTQKEDEMNQKLRNAELLIKQTNQLQDQNVILKIKLEENEKLSINYKEQYEILKSNFRDNQEQAKQDLQAYQIEIQELERGNQELQEQIQILRQKNAIIEKEKNTFYQENKQLLLQTSQQEEINNKIHQKLQDTKKKSSEMQEQLHKCQDKLKSNEKKKQMTEEKYTQKVTSLYENFEVNLADYQNENSKLTKQVEKLKKELNKRPTLKQFQEQEVTIQNFELQLAESKRNLFNARQKINLLQDEKSLLKNIPNSARATSRSIRKVIQEGKKEEKNILADQQQAQILEDVLQILNLSSIEDLIPTIKECLQAQESLRGVKTFVTKLQTLFMHCTQVRQKQSLKQIWKWIKNIALNTVIEKSQTNLPNEDTTNKQNTNESLKQEDLTEQLKKMHQNVLEQKAKIDEFSNFLDKGELYFTVEQNKL